MSEIKKAVQHLQWLLAQVGRERRILFLIALGMVVVSSTITTYIPIAIGGVVDSFDRKGIPFLGLIAVGALYVGQELFAYGRKLCVEKASTDTWQELSMKCTTHLVHINLDWLKGQELGGLNARFQRSIHGAVKLIKLSFMDIFPSFFLMSFSILMAVSQSLEVGIIIAMVVPSAFLLVHLQIKSQKGIRIALNRAVETIQAKLIEMLSGIEAIRASNFEEKQLKKIADYAEEVKEKEFNHHKQMMKFDLFKGLNKAFWNIIVLLLCSWFFYKGVISVGQVFTFMLLFNGVLKPLEDFHRFLDEAAESSILTGDLIGILSVETDPTFSREQHAQYSHHKSIIEIDNYSFGYKDMPILKGVSMKFESGQSYGIVGESGCGKSSLVKGILGFLEGSGSMVVAGVPVSRLNNQSVADGIAYAPQRPFIIKGSIRENIQFGTKDKKSDAEILEAARKAQILPFIEKSPDGLDSIVDPNGNNLSGGEAQRISLARVFLHHTAKFIILDEGTSALDNLTEKKVYDHLFRLTNEGKTVISIAHRLDTLQPVDKIYVMADGKIVQEGRFEEMSIVDGPFKKLLSREGISALASSIY